MYTGSRFLGVFLRQIGCAGTLFLDFVRDEAVRDLADFQDFQLHHRVFAAIGLGLYSTCAEDHAIFEEQLLQVAR